MSVFANLPTFRLLYPDETPGVHRFDLQRVLWHEGLFWTKVTSGLLLHIQQVIFHAERTRSSPAAIENTKLFFEILKEESGLKPGGEVERPFSRPIAEMEDLLRW
jgi:hypothetical protein